MGESAEEGEAGGLDAPPRLPPERAEVAAAWGCRRERAADVGVERAGAAEARLPLEVLLPPEAGGRAAGTVLAGAVIGASAV